MFATNARLHVCPPFVKVYLTLTEPISRSVTGLKRVYWSSKLVCNKCLFPGLSQSICPAAVQDFGQHPLPFVTVYMTLTKPISRSATGLEHEFSSPNAGHRPIDISRKVQDFGQRQQHQPFVIVYLTLTKPILRSMTGLEREFSSTHFGHRPIDTSPKVTDFGQRFGKRKHYESI